MHATIYSASLIGIQAHLVEVEVDLSLGMLQFFIVGLPDRAISESKQRIQTAIKNSGIKLPERKITVNLAPADLKKEGAHFDLPILIGILQAINHTKASKVFLAETLFLGELSLDGSIRPIRGVLAIAHDASRLAKRRIIVPLANAPEACLVDGLEVIGVEHIVQIAHYLRNEISIPPTKPNPQQQLSSPSLLDFDQVKGQYQAKRALQIAAAGHHNILFIGSPGAGKTMLAQRLSTLLSAMSIQEQLETSKLYSVVGKLPHNNLLSERPFCSPHHTISHAGLVGGGSFPLPGQISLAHNGILFLDELTEFKRSALESLRQPLESKTICIARAQHTLTYPASFILVSALNPCPCGYLGDTAKECLCTKATIYRYLSKLSGPLLDRIDIQLHVQSINYAALKAKDETPYSSAMLYQAVERALKCQQTRFGNSNITNASMPSHQIEEYCTLTPQAEHILAKAFDSLALSMRGYHKILKVARTIADMHETSHIEAPHIQEAIMYRSLDKTLEKLKKGP